MKLFLTSSISGSYVENGKRIPCKLDESNQFLDLLKKDWTPNAKCLILSSDPDNEEINNSFKNMFEKGFELSGLTISKMDICDSRNEDQIANIINEYDLLLLAGGHVPTQNQFFHRMNLRSLISDYSGIVIGISAGTMNSADVVYAQPELDGEATSPTYERYIEGLGITKINILPHFQDIKHFSVDGLRAFEDISLPDSKIRPYYALEDGSYILQEDGKTTLYGEAYWIQDGIVTKVCENGQSKELTDLKNANI